jgi:diadenosine tetraphosphate (Ap4A) HIT family hydrolase
MIAILDIVPVSRGHTLLMPRRHCGSLAALSVAESAAAGVWLPVLGRGVMRALNGDGGEAGEMGAWNVVQANGT